MKRHKGLTLVEMMVAMLLVLIVSAGALALVARGRAAQRTGEAVARLEETTDAALAILVEELRMAGYLGLAAPGSPVAGTSPIGAAESPDLAVAGGCGLSLAHDLGTAVSAADSAFGVTNSNPLRCSAGPQGRVVAGADTLTLRHASADATEADPGRLQLETNLRAARLMADGALHLGDSGRIHDLDVSVFYVSTDSTAQRGWPSLRRKRLVGGSRPAFQDEELVTGIEDLQVEIGLDATADQDSAVDRWVTPTEVSAADAPRAVRLWVLARSDLPEHPAVDQPALSYANREEPRASFRYRRKLSSRIVELRNLQGAP
ncbi:MAG TPA: PilW family protein [Steroidobacteraceae bacterium]|nr:PilW family protein [Steroidobacteraceae bacterium]